MENDGFRDVIIDKGPHLERLTADLDDVEGFSAVIDEGTNRVTS